MAGQTQTVLYEMQVVPKTEAADAALDQLSKKTGDIASHSNIPVVLKMDDTALGAVGGKLDDLKAKATAAGAGVAQGFNTTPIQKGVIEELETNLRTLEEQKKKAFSVTEAAAFETEIRKTKEEIENFTKSVENAAQKGEGAFGSLKNSIKGLGAEGGGGGGGILASVLGGAVGGGVATAAIQGFEFLSEKAKEAHDASAQVEAALGKIGLTGDAAATEMERIGESAKHIADDFALPAEQVKSLEGTVAGFSGLTGQALDHLTETSLGASQALGLSAEAVARMISKGADPESQASLSRLGIVFEKNATAAEKLAAIDAKLGPAIDAAKNAQNDAAGSFEKVKNDLTDTVVDLGSKLFEAIGPAIKGLKDLFDGLQPVLGPVIDVISFLLKISIQMTLLPLTAAKAFISWAGSLGFVKDAIAAVSGAIKDTVKFISNLIDTVKNAGSWLLSLIGIKDKDTAATKAAEDANRAKVESDNAAEESAQRITDALTAQTTAYEDNIKAVTQQVTDNASQYALLKKQLQDPETPKFLKEQIQNTLDLLKQHIKVNQQVIADDKASKDEALGNVTKQAAKEEDLLALAKKKSDAAAIELETQTKLDRLRAGTIFSAQDQLAVDQKRLAVFQELVDSADLLSKKKYQVQAHLLLEQDQIKTLEDKAKIDLKVQPVIDNAGIEGSLDEFNKWQIELDKQLRDAGIAIMQDGFEKENSLLDAKHNDELQRFNTGIELSQKEVDLKALIEKRQLQESLALKKKYAIDASEFEKNLTKSAQEGITSIIEAAFAKTQKLTALETADKLHGFDDQQKALTESLNKGAISYQEYSFQQQKLAQATADFKASQENNVAKAVEDAAKKAVSATLKVINAKIAEAAVSAFAGAVASDPTPLGLVEGAAISALTIALLQGIEGKLGFATGGLGLTGEQGPEVIGPVKDFSQFASQLAAMAAKETAQAIANQAAGNGGRRGQPKDLNFKFQELPVTGRSITYVTQRDTLVNNTERIGSVKTA